MQIYVGGVNELRKIDDYTVDFLLDGPNPVLLGNLTLFSIVSGTWAEKTRSQNVQNYRDREETYASRNTNGTGSFELKLWEPDKRVVMQSHRSWWDKPLA